MGAQHQDKGSALPTGTTSQMRVLVVDRDLPGAARTVALLKDLGYEAARASTPSAARRHLQRHPVGMVLVDASLGAEGAVFLDELREASGERHVVVSCHGEHTCAAGARAVLVKPFGSEQLARLMKQLDRPRRARATAEDLICRAEREPPPPGSALLPLLDLPDPWAEAVLSAADRDPRIAARVLTLANADLCTGARQFTSLREAVVQLGAARIRALALQTMLEAMHAGTGQLGQLLAAMLRNSLETARIARGLAHQSPGRLSPDQLFLTALLHNIGECMLVRAAVELRWLPTVGGLAELERVAGIEHERLGRRVLGHWGAPVSLVQVAASHHRRPPFPELDCEQRDRKLILLAWQAALARGFGYWPGHEVALERGDPLAGVAVLSGELGVRVNGFDKRASARVG
jgi:HD-like signal output (HDOD) protein